MIYTVTLNPAIDRELKVGEIQFDSVLRASARQVDFGGKGFNVSRLLLGFDTPMPQVKRSLGLIYAVNPFGADHQSSEHDPSYEDYPDRMERLV